MTIQEILQEKNLSRYTLSKKSGIPYSTLSDICLGKTELLKCSVGTLKKLSEALNLTMEEVLSLEMKQTDDQAYFALNLSSHLTKAIADLKQGQIDQVSYLDCLYDEVYGSINADYWSNVISKEQANYLRKKYL